jgi:hypothetical protein
MGTVNDLGAHAGLPFFATTGKPSRPWISSHENAVLPRTATHIELGDLGIFEGGRFRAVGTLKELGITHDSSQEGPVRPST